MTSKLEINSVSSPAIRLVNAGPAVSLSLKNQQVKISKLSIKEHGRASTKHDLDLTRCDRKLLDQVDKTSGAVKTYFESLSQEQQNKIVDKLKNGESITLKIKQDFQQYGSWSDLFRLILTSPIKVLPVWGDALFDIARFRLEKATGRALANPSVEVVDSQGKDILPLNENATSLQDLTIDLTTEDLYRFTIQNEPKTKPTPKPSDQPKDPVSNDHGQTQTPPSPTNKNPRQQPIGRNSNYASSSSNTQSTIIGLPNEGNTCFIAAGLQVFLHDPDKRQALRNYLDTLSKMNEKHTALLNILNAYEDHHPIKLGDLTALRSLMPPKDQTKQQDGSVFYRELINLLDNDSFSFTLARIKTYKLIKGNVPHEDITSKVCVEMVDKLISSDLRGTEAEEEIQEYLTRIKATAGDTTNAARCLLDYANAQIEIIADEQVLNDKKLFLEAQLKIAEKLALPNPLISSIQETTSTTPETTLFLKIPQNRRAATLSGQALIDQHFTSHHIPPDPNSVTLYVDENNVPGAYVPITERAQIQGNLPEFLTVTLDRYNRVNDQNVRVDNRVNMQEEITIQGVKYTLKEVIVHKGTADSGHYLAYVKEGNDWYLCNDAQVTLANAQYEQERYRGGYSYFYRRADLPL